MGFPGKSVQMDLVFSCHMRPKISSDDIKHRVSSVANPHSNNRGELAVKSLKRILRDYVSGSGCLDSDAITQALLAHSYTPCKTLKLSPAQLAYGRTLKDFFPRNVESLTPIPGNLLSAEVKDKMQSKIRADAGRRLDEHTKMLPELMVGDHVQLQNLRGKHPLKSDQNGVITSKNAFNSYSVRISGSGLITIRNRATLRKILPVVQTDNLVFGQGQKAL